MTTPTPDPQATCPKCSDCGAEPRIDRAGWDGTWLCGTLKDYPDRYADSEEKEQRFMAELERRGRKVQTILKDRRGGIAQNLSLRQLREEVEAGTRSETGWRDSTCSCMGDMFVA